LLLSVAVLGALAAPAAGLNLGLPGDDSMPKDSTVRKAYELRTEGFGEGSNGVLNVVADLSNVAPEQREAAVTALHDKLASYPGMDYVTQPMLSENGQGALLDGVPKAGPNNQETKDLVRDA